jgi:predicted lipoprotein with Yx(FWY)xxD motif/predicted outer membrane protein
MAAMCGLAVLLLISACGQGGVYGGGTDDLPNATATAKHGKPVLSAAKARAVGSIVVDAKGFTLYRFDKDSAKPPRSSCSGTCIRKWPPALAGEQLSTKGVEQNLVGKVRRGDGRWQLTLGGWPLYRFAKDRKAGDVKGQRVDGVWFVVAPDGQKATGANPSGSYDANTAEDGTTPTRWGPLSAADRDMLVRVRQTGLWEGPAGRQAQKRAGSTRVKAVGKQIAGEYPKLDSQVRTAAARLGVQLPSRPTAEQRKWAAELSGKAGREYDKVFVNRLRAAQGEFFAAVAQVRAGTRNTLIRAVAQQAVDVIMTHMTLLERTGLVDATGLYQPSPSGPSTSSSSTPYGQ